MRGTTAALSSIMSYLPKKAMKHTVKYAERPPAEENSFRRKECATKFPPQEALPFQDCFNLLPVFSVLELSLFFPCHFLCGLLTLPTVVVKILFPQCFVGASRQIYPGSVIHADLLCVQTADISEVDDKGDPDSYKLLIA